MMTDKHFPASLAEDLRALNDNEDAVPSGEFSLRWRHELQMKKHGRKSALLYALPAAAAMIYLIGGTALYRAQSGRMLSPAPAVKIMSVSAPSATGAPLPETGGAVTAFDHAFPEEAEEADLAYEETIPQTAQEANGESFNVREEARAVSVSAPKVREKTGFFESMKAFVSVSWPYALGALIVLTGGAGLIAKRRRSH